MKYKIQYNYNGLHDGWDDLLDCDHEDETTLTFDTMESAEAGLEDEKEDHRDSLKEDIEHREHTLDGIEDLLPDYRVVAFLEKEDNQ